MTVKHIIFLLLILCFISTGVCKKNVPTGPDADMNLELSGKITSNGQSFSNVDVYLSWDASKKTTTGDDGNFNFKDILNGNYIIAPSKLGYAFNPSNYEVGGQTRNNLNFTAQLALYGSGLNSIAADFTAKDQNNQNISLYDFFGKVILLDFSADWCGPCREEATHLDSLNDEYKDRGFQIITLLISGSPSDWAEEYDLTIPVVDDNGRIIWDIFGEESVPLNVLIDHNCTIRYKEAGYNESKIKELIKKYL